MFPDSAMPTDAQDGQARAGGRRWLRTARAIAGYLLVVVALLGTSQLLWLWHSWPVRHVLDSEELMVGAVL